MQRGENLIKKILLVILTIIFISLPSFGEEQNIYVVPIKGEINRATYNFVKNTVEDINENGAKGIIFEIDTYGGLVTEAQRIKDVIIASEVPTISYVNNNAQSAGVLITIASERVVMSKSSTIGSAETIPNDEKTLSMWRSVLRDTAQYRNRESLIIEAMADKDIFIEGITQKGKLVNLTSNEAFEYGIADFISSDVGEILTHFNLVGQIVQVEEGFQIKLAKYISNPYISSILLTIGMIGFVIEIFSPGFGFGGTIGIMGFALYFGGNILAGNSTWTSIILFVVGLILLIIEGMVPGFGLPGIGGIIFVIVGTIIAMDNFKLALLSLSISIIITTIVTYFIVKMGFKSKIFKGIILENRLDKEKGYLGTESQDKLLNKEGITLTELRPTGFIEVEGKKYDALSNEGMIYKNTYIKVVRVEGSKIFVRRT